MKLSDYVTLARAKKGMSLVELAQKVDCSYGTIQRIDTGKSTYLKPSLLKKLSDVLEIDYLELLMISGYVSEEMIADMSSVPEPSEDESVKIPVIRWKVIPQLLSVGNDLVPADISDEWIIPSCSMGSGVALVVDSSEWEPLFKPHDIIVVDMSITVFNDGDILLVAGKETPGTLVTYDSFNKIEVLKTFDGEKHPFKTSYRKNILGKVCQYTRIV